MKPWRWWDLKRAIAELDRGAPPAAAQAGYLVAFLLFEIFSWGLDTEVFAFSWDERAYSTPVGIGLLLVKILGPLAAYRANGGAAGREFLSRFFALSLPIRMRTLMALLLLAFPAEILTALVEGALHRLQTPVFGGLGVGLFWLAFNLCHYAWLYRVLREMAQPSE